MVYIHGGGYFAGSSSKYPPYALMNEDIVMVVIQYRLGVLGFLSTEDEIIPGNFGLKDQTEALRWVSRNIRHFGGDPESVTLFGESAGAASVHYQILTPKSDGLFVRAILQSGSAMCPWSLGAAHRQVAQHTSKLFNCPTHSSQEILECLQSAPGDKLVQAILEYFEWLMLPLVFGPRVDGDYLPAEPDEMMRAGTHKKMDVISGITSHEGGLHCLLLYSKEEVRRALVEDFSSVGPVAMDFGSRDQSPLPSARTIFNYYLGDAQVNVANADSVVKMFTDRHFAHCHDLQSIYFARNSDTHRVFRYELEYRGQRSATELFDLGNIAQNWVTHVDDLFYLFTGRDIWLPLTKPSDLKLRNIFTKMWTNFAATGNPTPDESLGFTWESSTEENFHYLSLSPSPEMKPDNRKEVRQFFATLPTRQNRILGSGKHPDEGTYLSSAEILIRSGRAIREFFLTLPTHQNEILEDDSSPPELLTQPPSSGAPSSFETEDTLDIEPKTHLKPRKLPREEL
ncbi:Carboxylesterase 5A [Halocaridina rubra]|uniref:Carboxylic ester hydrolase n=1 Tax=Halocaridina rubra TaxID=373956 RepID=A0AAN8WEF4_HALRR